jgi:hypothetical protein
VVGRPIEVPKIANPTNEEIENLVSVYKQELERLFYTYRPESEANKALVMIDRMSYKSV